MEANKSINIENCSMKKNKKFKKLFCECITKEVFLNLMNIPIYKKG